MKVLMINVVCGIKSTGRICTDLAEALDSMGHEVKIAYGRGNVPVQYQKYAVRIDSDFDVFGHVINARLFDNSGFGSVNATRKFIKWIREYNPDIIHLHNIHGYYLNIEMLFKYLKESGTRTVWTLHDCWPFTGHTPYCDVKNCQKWLSGCFDCPAKSLYPKAYIDRSESNWKKKKEIFNGVPNLAVITPSMWLKKLVQKSFLSGYEVFIINNGINITSFSYADSPFRTNHGLESKFILLGVATAWDQLKGLNDFIEISKQLSEEFQVILVGLSDKQLKELPSGIMGIKKTNSVRELAEIYSAADLFLNLSYCENYPTVNLESIACNTPVLTYETGGSPEIVEKFGGIIVPKGDIEQVISEILKSRKHSVEKHELVPDKYELSKENAVNKYIALYRNIEHNL